MSILTKPYEITVWEDVLVDGELQEQRIGIIGSDKMIAQCRAQEPNLVRSTNGTKKLSFKMYKHYIDNMTGEKVTNPFCDLLVSERKVKLNYNNKWYDFIVKDIVENSSNYLYTYSLEDANVQELSKNGFGVTLDTELMNNIGDAKQLGEYVLNETDWTVESEVFVQTVDEALIYVTIPAGTAAKHIIDQKEESLNVGVTEEDFTFTSSATVLAFYSCCKNKPHRFQFIYSSKGYNSTDTGYAIDRKDDRTIIEKDCQYYIDYSDPESVYKAVANTAGKINLAKMDLFLPDTFQDGTVGTNGKTGLDLISDSQLSSWYRGKRYGFAQQSVYVPVLDRYCSRFKRQENIPLIKDENVFRHALTGEITANTGSSTKALAGGILTTFTTNAEDVITSLVMEKASEYVGLKLDLPHHDYDEYHLKYDLLVNSGTLQTIGGHNSHYEPKSYKIIHEGNDLAAGKSHAGSYIEIGSYSSGKRFHVEIVYKKRSSTGSQPELFLQPNRGKTTYLNCTISNLSLTMVGDYLGYTESDYVSPTILQNHINNYAFESTGGWTAASSIGQSSKEKNKVENVYGRFVSIDTDNDDVADQTKFVNIVEDFQDGNYSEDNTYTPYMKMSFYKNSQFVLNSGIYDNRTIISQMPVDEEWVLDYKIVNSNNTNANDNFSFNLGEYIYDTSSGSHNIRNSFITFSTMAATGTDAQNIPTGCARKIIKVATNSYDEEHFKKNSKIYLQIAPSTVRICNAASDATISTTYITSPKNGDIFAPSSDITIGEKKYEGGKAYKYSSSKSAWELIDKTPQDWYIEKIALYKKVLDKDGKIIIPDWDASESTSADYATSGIVNNAYHYFNQALVQGDDAITDKQQLTTIVRNDLDYIDYTPVYNEGAKKVRSVTAKESNYFNILQSIAETFECWMDLEVTRNSSTGAITGKKVKFKNYIGENNYANFRYGVNLKDIQRTYSSKNITTKLIVKANSNEYGKDGFCTIQRAGANPTGENYIYDFQYYQNQGIMNVDDYLKTVYYIDGAKGLDAGLWTDEKVSQPATTDTNKYNLNGYYSRIKKINDTMIPISEELIGHKKDLIQKNSEKEVAEALKEAATTGIEQTAADFLALTGLYPEEAQTGLINYVALSTDSEKPGIDPREDWWHVDKTLNTNGYTNGVKIAGKKVTTAIKISEYEENCVKQVKPDQAVTVTSSGEEDFEFEKTGMWDGLEVIEQWEEDRKYTLTYTLKLLSGTLNNIGCHNSYFKDFLITVKKLNASGGEVEKKTSTNSVCGIASVTGGDTIFQVTVEGTYYNSGSQYSKNLWIQPNRSIEPGTVKCEVTNIKLTKTITSAEAVKDYDRDAHFYLNVNANVGESGNTRNIPRTYSVTCKIPANASTATIEQEISSVDINNSSVQKYYKEYLKYYEQLDSSTATLNSLSPQITALENTIETKEARQKTLLEYKASLNQLFFKKYSRFILEGTWISEEYTDDEKYYADAQSVLYNSCYPQVAYVINVLSLQGVPGYELFSFELGDKTLAIDEQFFGPNYQEEVVITEISEALDDPSKNTIKVQNFKNQFQDLFQKITATVQQTQYSTGSYEKGAALVEANFEEKNKFITDAINSAQTYLQYGQTVRTGGDGITITDNSNKKNQLKLVGGAILFSTQNPETEENTWMTGITNSGISASLITAGRLDTGAVQIMSGDTPVFRWDVYGISAYDALWNKTDAGNVISGVNKNKFVRFDKNGIYGIDNVSGIAGDVWYPSDNDPTATAAQQIDTNATFSLTWEGLKVTGNQGGTARIGRQSKNEKDYIMIVKNHDGRDTFRIDEEGNVEIAGNMHLGDNLEDDSSSLDNQLANIGTSISNVSSELESNVATLSSNISNVQTTLSDNINEVQTTLSGNINEVQTTLSGNIDNVQATLTSNINTVSTSLSSEINNVNTQLSSDINTLTNQVNNLPIGGENLALGSGTSQTRPVTEHIVYNYSQKLVANQNYTLSFNITKDENANVYSYGVYLRTTNEGLINIELDVSKDTTKYSKTFKLTDHEAGRLAQQIWIGLNGERGSGTVTVSNIKLEKGNVATSWTPAPEDVVGEINNTKALIDEVKNDLQNQIDGSLDTYFLAYIPKANKYPVVDEKEGEAVTKAGWGGKYYDHNGDLFYVISPGGDVFIDINDPTTGPEAGNVKVGDYWNNGTKISKYNGTAWEDVTDDEAETVRKIGDCYRWQYADSTNKTNPEDSNWVLVADTAVAEALATAKQAQATADGKMTVFSKPTDGGENWLPKPPYEIGDLWVNATYTDHCNNELMRCVVKATSGDGNISHWSTAADYTTHAEFTIFQTTYNGLLSDIQTQVDSKAEVWYQDTDPSYPWVANKEEEKHVGDLWHCTAEIKMGNSVIRKKNTEWLWKKTISGSSTTYSWAEMSVPDEVFDTIDGKATLYTSKPGSYHQNDLWFLDQKGSEADGNTGYPNYEVGTLLVASTNSDTYNRNHWVVKDRYGQAADDAKASAEAANTTASNAVSTAQGAVQTANGAVETATNASAQASAATTAAQGAVQTANGAVETANEAADAAGSAVETANSAASTAQGAVSAANGAVETANEAASAAESASAQASMAQGTATAALTAATTAGNNANAALSQTAAITNDISNGQGIFNNGLSTTASKNTINSFNLKASSLVVYKKGATQNDNNIIFSAQAVDDDSIGSQAGIVYLAGWTATADQLTNTPTGSTIGQANTFGIYPKGISDNSLHADFKWKGKMETEDNWIMSAGENFGLTKNGIIYANKGRIGALDIGDIASIDQVSSGINLATDDAIDSFNATISKNNYFYTISVGANQNNGGLQICSSSKNFFEQGKSYVVSYKFNIIKANATVTKIAGHHSSFTINKAVIDGNQVTGTYNDGYQLVNTNTGVTHTVELYVTCNNTSDQYPGIYIQPHRPDSSIDTTMEFMVYDLKVEQGIVKTAWTIPTDDQMISSQTGNYSWQFSPTQGIKMWNGVKENGKEIFKVDSHGLYIDGAINCSGSQSFAGNLSSFNTINDLVIKAGSKFGVDQSGTVYCSDINATAGRIGPFSFDGRNFVFCVPINSKGEDAEIPDDTTEQLYFIAMGPMGFKLGFIVQSVGWENKQNRWIFHFTNIRSTIHQMAQVSYRPEKVKNANPGDPDGEWNKLSALEAVRKLADIDINASMVTAYNMDTLNYYTPFATQS